MGVASGGVGTGGGGGREEEEGGVARTAASGRKKLHQKSYSSPEVCLSVCMCVCTYACMQVYVLHGRWPYSPHRVCFQKFILYPVHCFIPAPSFRLGSEVAINIPCHRL